MLKLFMCFFLALWLGACSRTPEPPPRATANEVEWVKPEGANIEAVFAQAKAANKPVFLYWGAVWCPPCNQIKTTVFNRTDFIERSRGFVPVYLDGDTKGAQQLGARFKVRGYPTMILFKPDGTELTRLPGEVDAARYMEVLGLGLTAASSVKDSLALALGDKAATLPPNAWRQLAYYSWDQDEAQLVPQHARAATLEKLAHACPATEAALAARLRLKAIEAVALDTPNGPASVEAALRVRAVLGDALLARDNLDILVNYSAEILGATTRAGSAERKSLLALWNTTLDRFIADSSLSKADHLSAVGSKLALAKLDLPKGAKPRLDAALLTLVRQTATGIDQGTTDRYERQALIPNAADLLSEAGLLDESDALLKGELIRAVSPYYHMLVLASNAKARGDKGAALDWSEKAWKQSQGPATRLQWGVGYVTKLIELAPHDAARIEKAATGVLAELEPAPETFYERNRRGLEKMGQKLLSWNGGGLHGPVLKKLSAQMDAVCAKLPAQHESRAACVAVFSPTRKPTSA